MFLILGKPIIHDGGSFSHTVPVALKSDQVTSAKIKHGMVVETTIPRSSAVFLRLIRCRFPMLPRPTKHAVNSRAIYALLNIIYKPQNIRIFLKRITRRGVTIETIQELSMPFSVRQRQFPPTALRFSKTSTCRPASASRRAIVHPTVPHPQLSYQPTSALPARFKYSAKSGTVKATSPVSGL